MLELMVLQILGSRRQLTEERHAWDRAAGIIHVLFCGGA
jgi:hypothetical protein